MANLQKYQTNASLFWLSLLAQARVQTSAGFFRAWSKPAILQSATYGLQREKMLKYGGGVGRCHRALRTNLGDNGGRQQTTVARCRCQWPLGAQSHRGCLQLYLFILFYFKFLSFSITLCIKTCYGREQDWNPGLSHQSQ